MKKGTGEKDGNGAVRILNGQYRDTVIPLQAGEKLVVGRDVNKCHLVLEAPWISRLHCTVSFDTEKHVYMVADYSENGTFIKGGNRLPREILKDILPGTVISIGEAGIDLQLV